MKPAIRFEWNDPERNKIHIIGYNDHTALSQALKSPTGSVVYVIDTDDHYYTGPMPKGSSVQANRAKRYYDHIAGLRQGSCPFEQDSKGKWVKKAENGE